MQLTHKLTYKQIPKSHILIDTFHYKKVHICLQYVNLQFDPDFQD